MSISIVLLVLLILGGIYHAVKKQEGAPQRPVEHHLEPMVYTPPAPTEETEEMIYFADDPLGREQTDRAQCTYRFVYKKVNGCYRAYITQMPNLNGRSDSCVATHRNMDGNQYFVCWDTPIHDLSDMQSVSIVWANNLQRYIVTGQRF